MVSRRVREQQRRKCIIASETVHNITWWVCDTHILFLAFGQTPIVSFQIGKSPVNIYTRKSENVYEKYWQRKWTDNIGNEQCNSYYLLYLYI